jgi:hypothetical protein
LKQRPAKIGRTSRENDGPAAVAPAGNINALRRMILITRPSYLPAAVNAKLALHGFITSG